MLLISLCVSSLCLFIERKNLTHKTCAPDFSARSMTKLYAKIKGARAISLFDFPKTWQVCPWDLGNDRAWKTMFDLYMKMEGSGAKYSVVFSIY